MTESEREAQERKVWKQEEPRCTCKPMNPRHPEAWYCVTPAMLEAWKRHSRDTRVPENQSDRKRAAWLWLNFSRDPKALELSGRDVVLGLDRWDGEAGMTGLQRMMFE